MITNRGELFSLMKKGALVITPNNRLSNELIEDFFRSNSQPLVEKPSCLPYSAFLQLSYKKWSYQPQQSAFPLLLSNQQSRHLWRKILAKSQIELGHEGLIPALEEAWARCHFWDIDFKNCCFEATAETRQFKLWALAFQEEMDRIAAMTVEQIAIYLMRQALFDFQYKILIWACFDEFTPQQTALKNFFSAEGIVNDHYDLAEQQTNLFCFVAKDKQDEYQQLLAWLVVQLSEKKKRIAVVIPNLQNEAPYLKRLLQRVLPTEFNISLGQPLASYPLVDHALSWLELEAEELTAQQLQLLLHSPYLAHSQNELLARSQFREQAKIVQEPYLSCSQLIKELERPVPKLAKILQGLHNLPEKGTVNAWISCFKERLRMFGFPGERSLNSENYQCYQRFLDLFDEFKQFNLISQEMTKTEALSAFKNLAKSTIFQPQKTGGSIQILGLLEAAGCAFDSLWVTGLTDQCLPQKTKHSAFIPLNLQRQHLMPYSCPNRELQLARKILSRLSYSSAEVVFSYPQMTEDKPNMPSPLIKNLPSFSPILQKQEELKKQFLMESIVEESYEIPFIENEKATGGTAILANQAKCPFRAFAIHRLRANAAPKVTNGPDPKERGQLIHKVMELIWQALENQKNLLTLLPKQLDELIEQAILHALEPLIQNRSHSFSALIQAVEMTKLKRLVQACLDWERKRPAFEVEALEENHTINLAGIDLHLRVDRLDKLNDGNKWVIDYKSSLPSSLPWNEERPKEPQLLLYALLDETIKGLLFAQLKGGQFTAKGLSAEEHFVSGVTSLKKEENWSDYRQRWQSQLMELAQEFQQGHCRPQPANASICQNCDLQGLCRFII